MKCPKCKAILIVTGYSKHETLCEHVMDPNGEPSLKPEYRCKNKCYPKRVFWDIYGDYYIAPSWLQRFLWKFKIYSIVKDPIVNNAILEQRSLK